MLALLISTAFALSNAQDTLTQDLTAQNAVQVQILAEKREPGVAQFEYSAVVPKAGSLETVHSVATYQLRQGQWVLTGVKPLAQSVEFTTETLVER